MKISMKNSEEKMVGGGVVSSIGHQSSNVPNANPRIRIAVFGQHEVGKSALTVRYLTRRYIGEYKSNTVFTSHFDNPHMFQFLIKYTLPSAITNSFYE
ncbi:Ras-like protein family member 11A-like [Orchesella cincta]|uniref:small monomeric GTPase n=1 Tax=Orchesella cincta TaxID=48709 RepID=A0A1D2NJI7_ORCCI|nr:Ras-like protein family member 11A-like [Orchesella cincta]